LAEQAKKSNTVALNWKEVWVTNCPMVSANNVDPEPGWCREEMQSHDRRLRNDVIVTGC
jgi:hypothetical protein